MIEITFYLDRTGQRLDEASQKASVDSLGMPPEYIQSTLMRQSGYIEDSSTQDDGRDVCPQTVKTCRGIDHD
ncbi:hypothetical protein D3C80_799740 [compost metagenome]